MSSSSRPVTSGRTGLTLDESDPDDAQIMARQRKAARAAGRAGQDRAAVTRGRPDLESAFDEGAAAAAANNQDQGGGQRAFGASSRFLSKGSWSPTLRPPARARDAGGLLVGLLLYTAGITWIRYGTAGWKGWLRAKFLNKPMQGLAAASRHDGSSDDGTVSV